VVLATMVLVGSRVVFLAPTGLPPFHASVALRLSQLTPSFELHATMLNWLHPYREGFCGAPADEMCPASFFWANKY